MAMAYRSALLLYLPLGYSIGGVGALALVYSVHLLYLALAIIIQQYY